MGKVIEVTKLINFINNDLTDEWKDYSNAGTILEAAQKMLKLGLEPSDAIDIINDIYFAAASEYGN